MTGDTLSHFLPNYSVFNTYKECIITRPGELHHNKTMSKPTILQPKKLQLFRELRGQSQYDLAGLTGITNYRISLLEKARFVARPKEVKAIARALGVTEDALTNPEETASLEAVAREAFLGEGASA